ncbi:MAG: choice-of-anchor V domain-containing protein [Bacteroidia bacterium]
MNKIKTLTILVTLTLFVTIGNLQSLPTGAPIGNTGSPADGNTCASCHGGSARPQSGIISSNIPSQGYVPGQKYTITVTLAGSGEKGFSVSPQKVDGTLLGSLTAGSGTQVNASKWVTHTQPKNNNPATWSFEWTAPSAGSGEVKFYGAFAVTRSNTYTDVLTVGEAPSTGITENNFITKFTIFPNPVVGSSINLNYLLLNNSTVKTTIIDLTGKTVAELDNKNLNSGKYEFSYNLPQLNNGIYFLQLTTNDKSLTKRIMINQ